MHSPGLQRECVWVSSCRMSRPVKSSHGLVGLRSRRTRSGMANDCLKRSKRAKPSRTAEACQPKSLSMDGGMVHIRGEGWTEMKVASIGTVEAPTDRLLDDTELPSLLHLTNLRYSAVLDEVTPFRQAVWTLVLETDFQATSFSSVVADGAP